MGCIARGRRAKRRYNVAGRRALTREMYELMLASYRDYPENHTRAAAQALCTDRLARRCWLGPPYRDYPWARPIREVIEEERQQAMLALREAELRAVREKALSEARAREERARAASEANVEAIKQETAIIRAARADALACLSYAAELVPAMRQFANIVKQAAAPKPDGSPPDITARQAMDFLQRHGLLMLRGVHAAQMVLDQGRLDRGDPTTIVAGAPMEKSMSYEEALEELQEAEQVLARARARGAPVRRLPPSSVVVEGEFTESTGTDGG